MADRVAKINSDSLNWPMALKVFVLIQVSLLYSLGGINTAIINPVYVSMAKELHISTIHASYRTTTCIIFSGVAPFIWVLLSNKYGQRPVLSGTTLLAFVSMLASALTNSLLLEFSTICFLPRSRRDRPSLWMCSLFINEAGQRESLP